MTMPGRERCKLAVRAILPRSRRPSRFGFLPIPPVPREATSKSLPANRSCSLARRPVVKMLRRFEPYAYALLRIVAGLLFLFHGLQKFGVLGGQLTVPPVSLIGLAA